MPWKDKEYEKEYKRLYRLKNLERIKENKKKSYTRDSENRIRLLKEYRAIWTDIIESHIELKCVQCGFSHPDALDFHHLNPDEKESAISVLKLKKPTEQSIEKFKQELDKCIVLCANCHRILHAKDKIV